MKKYIFALILIVLVIAGVAVAKFGKFTQDNNTIATSTATSTGQVACTMEAKQCPDGSYVGRSGPKCEFKACPALTSSSNKVVEKLCHLEAGRTYEVRLCGNYYNVFEPNLMDAPTTYYDIKGIFQGHCGGMPGPDGTSYDDPVCDVSMRCSDVNLCNPPITVEKCPQYSPPAPGWCANGKIVSGGLNAAGCPNPPKCEVANECVVGGCSGTVCEEKGEGTVTTCEYRPEYQCYKQAVCERQISGQCGWTKTSSYNSCVSLY